MNQNDSHQQSQLIQTGRFQTVIDRSEFQIDLQDGEDEMNRLISRVQTLFEFFDVWEVGLISREQKQENESQISTDESFFQKLGEKDFEMIENLQVKEKMIENLEKEVEELKSQSQFMQLELQNSIEEQIDLNQYLLKTENLLNNNEENSMYLNIQPADYECLQGMYDTRRLRNYEMGLNEESDEIEKDFENLNHREFTWKEQKDQQMKLHELGQYEEQLELDQNQLIMNFQEGEHNLRQAIEQATCAQDTQSSNEYKQKLDTRDEKLTKQENQIKQQEEILLSAILEFKQEQLLMKQMSNNPHNQNYCKNSSRSSHSTYSHSFNNRESFDCSTQMTSKQASDFSSFINQTSKQNFSNSDLPTRPSILNNSKQNPLLFHSKNDKSDSNIKYYTNQQTHFFPSNSPNQNQEFHEQQMPEQENEQYHYFQSLKSVGIKAQQQSPQSELKAVLSSRKIQLSSRKNDLSDFLSPSSQQGMIPFDFGQFSQTEMDQTQPDSSAAPLEAQSTMREKILQQIKINQKQQQGDRNLIMVQNTASHDRINRLNQTKLQPQSNSSKMVEQMSKALAETSLSPTKSSRSFSSSKKKIERQKPKTNPDQTSIKSQDYIHQGMLSKLNTNIHSDYKNVKSSALSQHNLLCFRKIPPNQITPQLSKGAPNSNSQEEQQSFSLKKPPSGQLRSSQKENSFGPRSLQMTPSKIFSSSALAPAKQGSALSSSSSASSLKKAKKQETQKWTGRKQLNYQE